LLVLGLLLHGAGGSLLDSRGAAFKLINDAHSVEYQCLLVDLRGHGDSDLDDYEGPHTIGGVCNDIMEVVQCFGISPHMVLACGGLLSNAVAISYLDKTLLGAGVPSSISYETSGINAISPPTTTVLARGAGAALPQTIQQLCSDIAHAGSKIEAFSELSSSTPISNRAQLRKYLMDAKVSKQTKTAASMLLDGLLPNYDLMPSDKKDGIKLGKQSSESLMSVPPVTLSSQFIKSFVSEFSSAKIEALGTRLKSEPRAKVYAVSGSQGGVLEHKDLDRSVWGTNMKAVLAALL
jgi:pimeloyl-ACP methyl ester carboxylesterase